MKQFIVRNRNTVAFRAFNSSLILSLCFYAVVRILFFEFPMTWFEEAWFFTKIFLTSSFVFTITVTTTGWLYLAFLKIKYKRKQLHFRLSNTLFLKKN